jgi:hypothetical protein
MEKAKCLKIKGCRVGTLYAYKGMKAMDELSPSIKEY